MAPSILGEPVSRFNNPRYVSTFSSALLTSSSLARFRRVSSHVTPTADHAVMPAVTGGKKIPTVFLYVNLIH